jgi:uncharacterized membrane protein YraQ (UPF0718 family)
MKQTKLQGLGCCIGAASILCGCSALPLTSRTIEAAQTESPAYYLLTPLTPPIDLGYDVIMFGNLGRTWEGTQQLGDWKVP